MHPCRLLPKYERKSKTKTNTRYLGPLFLIRQDITQRMLRLPGPPSYEIMHHHIRAATIHCYDAFRISEQYRKLEHPVLAEAYAKGYQYIALFPLVTKLRMQRKPAVRQVSLSFTWKRHVLSRDERNPLAHTRQVRDPETLESRHRSRRASQ